jgi:hypothetical protein
MWQSQAPSPVSATSTGLRGVEQRSRAAAAIAGLCGQCRFKLNWGHIGLLVAVDVHALAVDADRSAGFDGAVLVGSSVLYFAIADSRDATA